MAQLLIDIRRIGPTHAPGKPRVLFGELFDDDDVQQYYEALVGTLKSAKKREKHCCFCSCELTLKLQPAIIVVSTEYAHLAHYPHPRQRRDNHYTVLSLSLSLSLCFSSCTECLIQFMPLTFDSYSVRFLLPFIPSHTHTHIKAA